MASIRKKRPRKPPAPAAADATEYTLTDASNHILSLGTSVMTCGVIDTDQGQKMIVTIRTPSTTVSVALERAEAVGWITEIGGKVNLMKSAPPAELRVAGKRG